LSSKLTNEAAVERIDHIGLLLWHAAQAWRDRLTAAMVEGGVPWYAEARGGVVAYIEPGGTRQSDVTLHLGLSRQAVQQLVDELEQDGIVYRAPDPHDGRGKIIRCTAKGAAVLRLANQVKRRIERDYLKRLGPTGFSQLQTALRVVADPVR